MAEPEWTDEALDALLAPGPDADSALRADLLRRTAGRLRARRRLRYAARVGLLAACFLGGVAAARLVEAPRPEVRVVAVAVPVPRQEDERPAPPERTFGPAELEREAERTFVKAESARRFREAGDRYLRDEANFQAALRCYRNYLDEAEGPELAAAPDDTWLLTSLKNARRKETGNANLDN